jgi:hypothetical protein
MHRLGFRAAIAAASLVHFVSQSAGAATITVTTVADNGAGSLRDAVVAAAPGDVIDFAVAGAILLTSGEILINKSLTITGPGARQLTVSGNVTSRVFRVAVGNVVGISGLTLADGRDPVFGGAVTNSGSLSLVGVTIRDSGEAGVHNESGFLSLTDCTIRDNFAVQLNGSGGGIMNRGGTLVVTNSTVSGNTSDTGFGGGGILNFSFPGPATATIVNSTIADNINTSNGGRGNAIADGFSPPGSITLKNTILASTSPGVDCYPASLVLTSLGHNLASDTSCGLNGTGDAIDTDPLLDALADNGGETDTHSLSVSPVSPAIDAVPVADCTDQSAVPISLDQRGTGRPQDGDGNDTADCDAGAYEVPSLLANCPYAPLPGCVDAGATSVAMKDNADPSKKSLTWKWKKGVDAMMQTDFGDPVGGSSRVRLCIYDDVGGVPVLATGIAVDPGGTCAGKDCWRGVSDKGWAYKNKTGNAAAITQVVMKGGAAGKPQAQMKGRGAGLPLPVPFSPTELFDQDPSVTMQLHTGGPAGCLTAAFSASGTKKNSVMDFKAKGP